MSKKLIVGVIAGVALVSVATLLLSKNSRFNLKSIGKSAGHVLDGLKSKVEQSQNVGSEYSSLSHNGKNLAKKAYHNAQHAFSSQQ